MCIELRSIDRVLATHESAGGFSKDAKMGMLGSIPYVKIRVIVVFVLLTTVSILSSLSMTNRRRGTKCPRSLPTSYSSLRPGLVVA